MESARAQIDSLTPSQRRAVEARGNVLVMAGAGTGKTHTLVQRCLDCLCQERAALDEILVVTFTEAAATEMKQRLRAALEKTLYTQLPGAPNPASAGEGGSTFKQHLTEQLALFDTAPIGTLHSFCLRLVREHFYELGLDPQLAVLDPGEASLLAGETLDEQLQAHYAEQAGFSAAVQNLIQIYGNGDERPIRTILRRLHDYAQTRPDAGHWLAEQLARFASPEPLEWRNWLSGAVINWREEWLPVLEKLKGGNEKAAELLKIIKSTGSAGVAPAKSGVMPDLLSSESVRHDAERSRPEACSTQLPLELVVQVFERILAADGQYPPRKKTALREPLKELFADTAFLHSLMSAAGNREPLAEDWDWVHSHMSTLLQLTQEFGQKFADRKRADGALDFHDLEQFALKLLWDSAAEEPTAIAGRWRQKIRFVFVDEYQDINAAQDKIIQALSRDERWGDVPDGSRGRSPRRGNRFLVGDVKQSIYRFRLADPKIFRDYAQTWRGENGQVIPLTDNFRSRESLLGFVNSVFELFMREEVGGVEYDAGSRLQFGAPEQRAARGLGQNPLPRAELLLRFKGSRNDSSADDDSGAGDLAELEETEKEARLVAQRLCELVVYGHKIRDEGTNAERAVEWRDMVVLLRAPANKAEAYAKEFERAGVPLVVERGGFYDAAEIADLLNLLKLLDNPLQDIPAIAVLRSPLVGLSLDELATVRLSAKDVYFWTALNAEGRRQKEPNDKVERFLEQFSRWRQLARQVSLSQCLEAILAATHYADWLRSRPRGAQRRANVEHFLGLAQQFDQFQRQGLFRFLKFIEAQRGADAEPEVAAAAEENAVRLMSIHQSKGLEFPVVVVADLAKAFNEQDLRGEIIFDDEFGVCPRVKPPHTGRRYPSLPHWLARRRQRRELRGEELRLWYVAMTRARDTLILTATISENKWKMLWTKPEPVTAQSLVAAKSCADWLGAWFAVHSPQSAVQNAIKGELPHLRWRIAEDEGWADKSEIGNQKLEIELPVLDETLATSLHGVLNWNYKFKAATSRAAKSSVTALRRQADELDDEAEPIVPARFKSRWWKAEGGKQKLSAAEIGAAHHKFLQRVALEKADKPVTLAAEAQRLETGGVLTTEEHAALNFVALAAFWNSKLGQKILSQSPDCIRRELAFTARFSPAEADAIIGAKTPLGLEHEFVVVQGVADLVALLAKEIWLVDFKTDEIGPKGLPERRRQYEPQLKLYAAALSRIYSRPVTNCWLHFLAVRKTVNV